MSLESYQNLSFSKSGISPCNAGILASFLYKRFLSEILNNNIKVKWKGGVCLGVSLSKRWSFVIMLYANLKLESFRKRLVCTLHVFPILDPLRVMQ